MFPALIDIEGQIIQNKNAQTFTRRSTLKDKYWISCPTSVLVVS